MKWYSRKVSVLAYASVFGIAALAGCDPQPTQNQDLKNVPLHDPQKAELYSNVDGYPNVVRICIDGVAFATMQGDYERILRVPEWDSSFCGTKS